MCLFCNLLSIAGGHAFHGGKREGGERCVGSEKVINPFVYSIKKTPPVMRA